MGKRFGECFKNALDSKKMSVSDFSKASGIKRENIYRYINGEREPFADKDIELFVVNKV